MKWVYVPFMFALAFLYTKISFNNFERKAESEQALEFAGRTPASTFELNEIKPQVKRAPAAVFYQNLNESSFLRPFAHVSSFYGTVVGDVGVDSFGFIVDDKGKALFGVRDIKEVSHGQLFHDVVGHLVSGKNYDKKITWISYFDAYKSGLLNEKRIYSYYIEKGLEEAQVDIRKKFEANVSREAPFVFTKMKSGFVRPTKAHREMIEKGLKKTYSQIQFFDIYESAQEKGHYQLLVRLHPLDKIEWFELVESTECEYEKAFQPQLKLSFKDKIWVLKEHVYDGKLDRSLASVTFDKKNYFVKSANHFASKIPLEAIPSDDYHDIVLDQAYALGKMHRASLKGSVEEYVKAWARIPAASIDEKTIELKYKLKDLAH